MLRQAVEIGEIVAGRYRIDRELGAGAMGVVYAAWHLELDQPVAVKVLASPVSNLPEATARFRREVRAAAKIRSEHVARVLDVGSLKSGLPYMVLELLDGNDLDTELQLRGALPIAEAVGYVLQAIEALAEAHAAGIIHRDLKPANLFLAQRADRTRILKVLDFGISKSSLSDSSPDQVSLTTTGMIMGSPLYMSPEQLSSTRSVDARTDIWALGTILYQLLAGTTPFRGDSIPELCAVLFRDTPAPLSHHRDDVPPEVDRAILRCLERDREQRYPNVGEFARDIVAFAPQARIHCDRASRVLGATMSSSSGAERDLPRRAVPETGTERATQVAWSPATAASVHRRPWKLGLLLLLVSGAGLVFWLAPRARSADPQLSTQPSAAGSHNLPETSPVSAHRQPEPSVITRAAPIEKAPADRRSDLATRGNGGRGPDAQSTVVPVHTQAGSGRPKPITARSPRPPAAPHPPAKPVVGAAQQTAERAGQPAPRSEKPASEAALPDYGGRR